jgi:predicted dehydrogenase
MRLIQVGLGGWGLDWARTVVPIVPGVRPVAYVDTDPAMLARAHARLDVEPGRLFPSLTAALNAVPADAVLATLPTAFHAGVAAEALRAGLHVLVEKPFTSTLAEACALAALAAEGGRILMVSQNYRHHPAVATVADLIRRGVLGGPLGATISFRKNWLVTNHRYHNIPGPLLLDMAVHHFDLLRMLLGEVARLTCRSWTTPDSPFTEHAAAEAILELRSGLIVGYHGSWLSRGAPTFWGGDWTIECEQGVISFATRGAPLPDVVTVHAADGCARPVALLPVPALDRAGTLAAFAQAVATGRAPADFTDAADNVHTLALCFAAMRSAAGGGAWVDMTATGGHR